MCNARSIDSRVAKSDRSAFTLIELLVVISIIAMLISILLPSLSAARKRAKESACLGKLKGLTTAGLTYASDDKSENPIPVHSLLFVQDPVTPTFLGAYEWGGKSGVGHPGVVDGPSSGQYSWVTSQFGTKAHAGPATRPLNGILYSHEFTDNLNPEYDRNGALHDTQLDLAAYRCPGDDGPPRGYSDGRGPHCSDWIQNGNRSSYDQFGNSYAANTYWVGGHDETIHSFSPFLLPLSRVPNPSRTLMFEENIGRWAWLCRRGGEEENTRPGWAWGDINTIDPGPTKSLRGWHGRDWTFNRSFCDGHAATQKIIIEGTADSQGYSFHYRHEALNADVRWDSMNNIDWITVRGPGWQKDTLPNRADVILPGFDGIADHTRVVVEGCVLPGSEE